MNTTIDKVMTVILGVLGVGFFLAVVIGYVYASVSAKEECEERGGKVIKVHSLDSMDDWFCQEPPPRR